MGRYQHDYASGRPQMYDVQGRIRKAWRIVKLLEDYYGKKKLKELKVLDVGASTGIIDNELSKHFNQVVGIDIDSDAIDFAKKKFKRKSLVFQTDDAMKLSFKSNLFDVVICTQIYEHVPDPKKLFKEIFRVLKPGGTCYVAALNKLWPWEPHYDLPFLSWLPKQLGNAYVRVMGKAPEYYETLKTYWQLKTLMSNFQIIDYTPKILRSPKKFKYAGFAKFPMNIVAWCISFLSKYVVPTFFFLIVKPQRSSK